MSNRFSYYFGGCLTARLEPTEICQVTPSGKTRGETNTVPTGEGGGGGGREGAGVGKGTEGGGGLPVQFQRLESNI